MSPQRVQRALPSARLGEIHLWGSPSVLCAGSYPWPEVMVWAAAIPQGSLTSVGMTEHSTKMGYCIARDKVGVPYPSSPHTPCSSGIVESFPLDHWRSPPEGEPNRKRKDSSSFLAKTQLRKKSMDFLFIITLPTSFSSL